VGRGMGHGSCGPIRDRRCGRSIKNVPNAGARSRRKGELHIRLGVCSFHFRPKSPPLPPFNAPMAEQAFLAKHYDENSKKPDRDPRGAFRNPTETATAGIVGPLGSSSFNLPNVEKALADMETGLGGSGALNASVNGDAARRLSRGGARPTSGLPAVGGAGGSTTGRTPASPPLSASPSSTGGQAQHEVLHNFFQSLLSAKDRAGASAAASRATAPSLPKSDGSPGGTDDAS
jgi:dynein light intermediate chain 1